MVNNLPANAGGAKDLGLIPVSGRSPGVGNGNPLSILAWELKFHPHIYKHMDNFHPEFEPKPP